MSMHTNMQLYKYGDPIMNIQPTYLFCGFDLANTLHVYSLGNPSRCPAPSNTSRSERNGKSSFSRLGLSLTYRMLHREGVINHVSGKRSPHILPLPDWVMSTYDVETLIVA